MEKRLGKVLADLALERRKNQRSGRQQLSIDEKDHLGFLHEHFNEIISTENNVNMFSKIPLHECQTERPFLDRNEEFFLSLLLIGPNEAEYDTGCIRLIKHLNDCYHCFEIFCQVVSDFYNRSKELNQKE